jgi:D-xylose transport system substrate-binding protein
MEKESPMLSRRLVAILPVIALLVAACTPAATGGGDCIVGVSWNNFQQPRWARTDKPAMQEAIEAGGGSFIDADANLDALQQATDIDSMIEQGADVLVLLAQDGTAILPSVEKAQTAGIPVIAYDRLLEDPDILYLTFDNQGVGIAEAEAILAEVPSGNYVVIKGDPGDANATFLRDGFDVAGLQEKVDAGDITIIYEEFTDAWSTENAETNMDAAIQLAKADGIEIDAVLSENDSMALGVVASLTKEGLQGTIPVSGQDGDFANLNNVAKGLQFVDVWKNSFALGKTAGEAALQLCDGKSNAEVTAPDDLGDVEPSTGLATVDFDTPGGNTVKSIILTPTPVTFDTLDLVVDSWIPKAELCAGVDAATAPEACK